MSAPLRPIRPVAGAVVAALVWAAAAACSSSPPTAPAGSGVPTRQAAAPAVPPAAVSGGVSGDQAAPGACPWIGSAGIAAVLHQNVTGSDANPAATGRSCSFVLQSGTVVTIAVFSSAATENPGASTAPAGSPVAVNGGRGYWDPPATLTVLTDSGSIVVVGLISLANLSGPDHQSDVVAIYDALHGV